MITLAEVILNNKTEYNGHKQLTLTGVTIDADELCKDLNKFLPNEVFYAQRWDCGGFDIYQKDVWEYKEHHLGHRDKLMLSVEVE